MVNACLFCGQFSHDRTLSMKLNMPCKLGHNTDDVDVALYRTNFILYSKIITYFIFNIMEASLNVLDLRR